MPSAARRKALRCVAPADRLSVRHQPPAHSLPPAKGDADRPVHALHIAPLRPRRHEAAHSDAGSEHKVRRRPLRRVQLLDGRSEH